MKNSIQKMMMVAGWILALFMFSCEQQEENTLMQQPTQFAVDMNTFEVENGRILTEEVVAVVVSIKDSKKNLVVTSKKLPLYDFNGKFLSEPISLFPGVYYLSEFFVIDKNNKVIFASPIEGSAKAYLVKDPLDIKMTIVKNKVLEVKPEVLHIKENTPQDFGYATFALNEVETFVFKIGTFLFNEQSKTLELTPAKITIMDKDKKFSYTKELIAGSNQIALPERYSSYVLKVEKTGYVPFEQTYTKAELKAFDQNNRQIIVILKKQTDQDTKLIFWNKLGSFEEVTNSEIGPNLFPGSGMIFKLGKYGNGVYIPQYYGIRSVHSPYSPRYVIPLWSFSIEFWYKRTISDWEGYSFISGAYEDNGKGIVDFTGHKNYVGMWNLLLTVSNNSGNWISRHTIDLQNEQKFSEFFPKNEWVHIAISHDAAWPVGKRMKLFRNGVELAGFTMDFDEGNMSHVGEYGVGGFRIGNFVAWDTWGASGIIDNLKIYNYPKTDFSDRDKEGY
jgi:hypothetical protein